MLERLGKLVAKPFASRDEAIAAVLDVMHRVSGMRTPFLARTNHGRFEVVAVKSFGGCPLDLGSSRPL